MELPSLLTEEQIKKFTNELGLTKEQIIEFNAEFKAYDTDGDGTITSIDLGIVNKVRYFSYLRINKIIAVKTVIKNSAAISFIDCILFPKLI